jgi:hypothetical protein
MTKPSQPDHMSTRFKRYFCLHCQLPASACKCDEPNNGEPEPARPSEESVTCSDWVGQLEAALRNAAEARKRAEEPWSEQAYNEAWADERAIARVIRIMRGRCPTK